MGPAPWVRLVVMADHIFGAVICQPPGHENDRHVHGYDEWWVIMEGEIDWIVEGREDLAPQGQGWRVTVACQTLSQARTEKH